MPLARSARAFQASALPDAYAPWTDDAVPVVDQLTSTLADCATGVTAALPAGSALSADTPSP